MSEWYYQKDGQRCGPVDSAALKRLAAGGGLAPSDLIWREGLPQWVAAEKAKGLFAAPAGAPVPAAARAVAPVAIAPVRTAAAKPAPGAPAAAPVATRASVVATPLRPPPLPATPAVLSYETPVGLLPIADEDRRRRRWLVITGALLVVAAIFPSWCNGPVKDLGWEIVNWKILSRPGKELGPMAGAARFMAVYPLVAGVFTVLLALAARGRWRGAVLAGIGVLPFAVGVIAMIAATNTKLTRGEVVWPVRGFGLGGTWRSVLPAAGAVLLLCVSRARWYRPRLGMLYWLGVAGAGAWLAFQLIPTSVGGKLHWAVLDVWRAAEREPLYVAAWLSAASLTLMCAALSLVNVPRRTPAAVRSLSWVAFLVMAVSVSLSVGLVLWGFAISVHLFRDPASIIGPLPPLSAENAKVRLLTHGSILLKAALWGATPLMLLAMGLIDAMVGPAEKEADAVQPQAVAE